jgi:hypothetical protein
MVCHPVILLWIMGVLLVGILKEISSVLIGGSNDKARDKSMRKIFLGIVVFFIPLSVFSYPDYLRQGVDATESEISVAIEMYEQGWRYTMPTPKSAKAAWGVRDGRTTWYNGWWKNEKTQAYSSTTPHKNSDGNYIGDDINTSNSWRRGGSPGRPDVYMFLLSKSGGPR